MSDGNERRRYERFSVYCPLEYKTEDNRPKESSVTLNVSEGGALISSKSEFEPDSNIIIKFRMKDELFFLIGTVKHVRKSVGDGNFEIGVEFWNKPPSFSEKFNEEMAGIIEYQRRCGEEQGQEISLAEASIGWYKDVLE